MASGPGSAVLINGVVSTDEILLHDRRKNLGFRAGVPTCSAMKTAPGGISEGRVDRLP